MYGSFFSEDYLAHVGRSKRDGAKVGSGRYPLGSGEHPRAKQLSRKYAAVSNKNYKWGEYDKRKAQNPVAREMISEATKDQARKEKLDSAIEQFNSSIPNIADWMVAERSNSTKNELLWKYKSQLAKQCGIQFDPNDDLDRFYVMYEDWDAGGSGGAFDLYLQDKHKITYAEYSNNYKTAMNELTSVVEDVVSDYLGEHGNKPVKYYSKYQSVTESVVQRLTEGELLGTTPYNRYGL